jgi:iron complex transport system permease protein
VLLVRLPRVLLAALAGAGLAVAGAALQGVFRNPLVAPQVLGISPGAAVGGALAILLGISGALMVGLAFAFGLAALLAVGLLARIGGRTEIVTVILAGLVIGALFGALVSLLQFVADPNGSLPAIVYWLMGSFASATWERLGLAIPGIAAGLALLLALRFRLNLLSLDEAEARRRRSAFIPAGSVPVGRGRAAGAGRRSAASGGCSRVRGPTDGPRP